MFNLFNYEMYFQFRKYEQIYIEQGVWWVWRIPCFIKNTLFKKYLDWITWILIKILNSFLYLNVQF